MTASQRRKGKGGELELAGIIRDLSGWDVRRRVRQHDGDSDLEGIPGWSVEVKRHKAAGRAEIGQWWRQTVQQATRVATDTTNAATARISCRLPVLFYRLDRADWRAVWPVSVLLTHQRAEMWTDYAWTCESRVEAWAAVARESVIMTSSHEK